MPYQESLNCNFYEYTGDPRVANKSMGTAVYSCSSIQPIEALSDLDIKLLINYPYHIDGYTNTSPGAEVYPSATAPPVMKANYVAIDNKWYQITSKERLPGNALAIYATLDGVKTYWSEIIQCSGVCERSDAGNSWINDPYYSPYSYSIIGYDSFGGDTFPESSTVVLSYVK